eukprot:2928066-Lingulodinium_polyedra.AAC.1
MTAEATSSQHQQPAASASTSQQPAASSQQQQMLIVFVREGFPLRRDANQEGHQEAHRQPGPPQ